MPNSLPTTKKLLQEALQIRKETYTGYALYFLRSLYSSVLWSMGSRCTWSRYASGLGLVRPLSGEKEID